MGRSLPLTLNGSEKGETRLSGWRLPMSFHSARMGLIQANHFGNLHFSERGGFRPPLEDFTGVSRSPSDTVQMIPALTGWIAAYGKKNGNSGSRRMQRWISFLRFLCDFYFIALQVSHYEVARSLPIRFNGRDAYAARR
jgi:hypothetical protein